jgi:hypothetical protein
MIYYVTYDCVILKQLLYCIFMASEIHTTNSEVTNRQIIGRVERKFIPVVIRASQSEEEEWLTFLK